MKPTIAGITFLIAVSVCFAQTVTISGVVKSSGGSGIEGVTVRLGKANILTTTAPDGSFSLGENTTGVKPGLRPPKLLNGCPIISESGMLFVNLKELVNVCARVYDVSGRLLFSYKKPASSLRPSIALPDFGSGVHFYQISLGDEHYLFTSVDGVTANHRTVVSRINSAPAKQAQSAALVDDALIFTKPGYRLHRIAFSKPDTSGIQITLAQLDTGSVTDADGNVYKTVRIGNQVWTTENLRTTKYNDGSGIPLLTDDASWGKGSAGYCFYNNSKETAANKKSGALYNWNAVKTGKLAPKDWHVSTDAEWDTLQNYLMRNGYNYDGTLSVLDRGEFESDENKTAKSLASETDWAVDSTGTGSIGNDIRLNNASGFSALPVGYRLYDGGFFDKGNFCFFWTSTETDASFAWYRHLWDVTTDLNRGNRVKFVGCSIRLVRQN